MMQRNHVTILRHHLTSHKHFLMPKKFQRFYSPLQNVNQDIKKPFNKRYFSASVIQASTPKRSEEGIFIHKLNDAQKMFVWGHRAGTRFTAPWYTLNSRKPLTSDLVHEAMVRLHRKCPTYQLVLREQDGEMWWFKPNHVDIDFKVLEKGVDKHEAINSIFEGGFDETNGPLWKVRLLPAEENEPCQLPDVKKDYPYQYHLFTTTHHGLADGITEALISQHKVDALNDVINGVSGDDAPTGEYVCDAEYQKTFMEFKEKLLGDSDRLESIKLDVLNVNKSPILSRTLDRPSTDRPTTKHKSLHVSKDVLHKFISNCKRNGVSYGTGFQTATNTALVELARESGSLDEDFDLSVNLAVDLRRYMKRRELPIHGLHARTISYMVNVTKDARKDFWKNCREIQSTSKAYIKSGAAVEQDVVNQLYYPSISPEQFYKTTPPVVRDYGFSNLGDFSKVIPGTGEHVQLTDLGQFTAVHRYIYPFLQQVFTFRGHFHCTMSYATDWLSEDDANELADRIAIIILQLSKD